MTKQDEAKFSITVTNGNGDIVANVVGYNSGEINGIAKDGYEVEIKGEA